MYVEDGFMYKNQISNSKKWEKHVFEEEEEEPKIIRVLVLRFMMWVSQHHDPKCHRNIFGNILAPNYIRVFFSHLNRCCQIILEINCR